ncbi:MAG TPA: hypothetical protein PLZ93_08020, partial [Nocardioides sp.]|nr:hypothetical protein [Nocardioides sp.]
MRARRTMTARIAALAMLGSAVVTGLTWAAGPVPPAAATTTQAAPIELLQDGGFEDWSGPTAQPNQSWRVTANGNGTDNGDAGPICHQSRNCVDVTSHPRLGNGWLWFHSNPSTLPANTSVSQDVVIPVGVPVTLSFFFANFAARAPYSGRLTVQVDGVDVMWLSEQETTFDYRPRTVDLSAYATGTSHTLTFKYHRDFGSGPASILVDDVSLSTPGLSVDESIPDLVPVHFSDQLPLTFSATSHQAPGHRLTATVQGLPKGLSLATSAVSQGSSTWEFIGRVVAAASPVPYPVLVTVSDEVQEQQLRFSIRVDPESASVAYTGPTRAMPDATGDKPVDLLLTAHVTQQADGDPGQLSLANRATFVDLDHNNEVLCTSEVDDSGQASCRHLGALPAGADGRTYRIQVLVGDDTYFTRARSAPVPVTVGVTGPDRWLLSSSASFTFASTRAGTSFACSLDGAAPTSCGSPYAVSGLGPATHVVTVA